MIQRDYYVEDAESTEIKLNSSNKY